MMRAAALGLLLVVLASPAAAASGETGLFYPVLNLLVLVAALVYFARKPVRAFFHDRRLEIQENLHSAAELRREAEERYAKWQRKLIDLEDELAQIREKSRERAEAERRHIIADAEASAGRIRSDATAAIDQELRRSREILREEAADLAIELAGNLLREQVNEADRDRLVSEFIERIEHTADSDTGGPEHRGVAR